MSNPVSPASLHPPSLTRTPSLARASSQAQPALATTATTSTNSAPPQTFWADDFGPTQYTFYQDSSPPVSIYEKPRAGAAAAAADPEGQPQAQPAATDPTRRWSTPTNRWSIGTLPRTRRPWVFWLGVGVVVLVLIGVAVGVGVGVGVGSNKARHKNADAGASRTVSATATPTALSVASSTGTVSSSNSINTTLTSSSSTTPTTTTGTYTGVIATATLTCPATPNARITDTATRKVFKQSCGRDYGTQDGAVDIGHVTTTTWVGCIYACAQDTACSGCGWGFIQGDAATGWRCWMKRNVSESASGDGHAARKDWAFAVLV